MHSERKYLLLHDGLSRAKAQVQLCFEFRASDSREDGLLAKNWQKGGHCGQQPLHINDQCLLITPL